MSASGERWLSEIRKASSGGGPHAVMKGDEIWGGGLLVILVLLFSP